MNKQLAKTVFVLLTTLFILGCKNEREFPSVQQLSTFKKTEFIPSLEHPIAENKNAVYCASLLFAWDEKRKQINEPISVSDKDVDLQLLNQSTTFRNTLNSDEYEASGQLDGDRIKASAAFSKSLPFALKLNQFENGLTFNGRHIASFGVTGNDHYEQLEVVQIVYYKNDQHFIIKLLPKNKEHEIILFKSDRHFKTMAAMTKEIAKLTELGKTEKKNDRINWKYYFNEEDSVVIPKFNFNIETNFTTLEGKECKTAKRTYTIEKAWQRTAFMLNESGAAIESEATMEAAVEAYERPKPKIMKFDKPFLILLKRTWAKNPYFGLWTTNAELMSK